MENSKYIELLAKLISINPVSSDYPAVNRAENLMMNFLKSHGVYCCMETIGDNQVLWAVTSETRSVNYLLNAHLDVVPGRGDPRIEDGYIYGRGGADCLGNAVCAARLLCNLKRQADVGCIFTADEEIGGMTTAAILWGIGPHIYGISGTSDWYRKSRTDTLPRKCF